MNAACREKICSAAYDELTEFAEHRIRTLAAAGDDVRNSMALGVWDLWYNATVGFQRVGDSERLESLFRHNPARQEDA